MQTRRTAMISATLPLMFFISSSLIQKDRSPKGLGGFVFRGDGADGALSYFHLDTIGSHFDDDGVVLDGQDSAANAAGGGNPVAGLNVCQHLLPLLLPLLLRTNHCKVHDGDQEQDGEHPKNASASRRRARKDRQTDCHTHRLLPCPNCGTGRPAFWPDLKAKFVSGKLLLYRGRRMPHPGSDSADAGANYVPLAVGFLFDIAYFK